VTALNYHGKFSTAGFSLLEVLIASTVFSVGLAGLAALLLTSIGGSADARREGIAVIAAASLATQIRVSRTALGRFLNPPEIVSRICTNGDQCTPEQQADYNFKLWQLELADSIRDARGIVCYDSTFEDGNREDSGCDGSGALGIKIFWDGPGDEANPIASPRRFVLAVN